MTNVLTQIPEGYSICSACLGTREQRVGEHLRECEECKGSGTHPLNILHRHSKHLKMPSVVIPSEKTVDPLILMKWAEKIGAFTIKGGHEFYAVEIRRTERPVRAKLVRRVDLLDLLYAVKRLEIECEARQAALRTIAERLRAYDLLGHEPWRIEAEAKAFERARRDRRSRGYRSLWQVNAATRDSFLREIRTQARLTSVFAEELAEFDTDLPFRLTRLLPSLPSFPVV